MTTAATTAATVVVVVLMVVAAATAAAAATAVVVVEAVAAEWCIATSTIERIRSPKNFFYRASARSLARFSVFLSPSLSLSLALSLVRVYTCVTRMPHVYI